MSSMLYDIHTYIVMSLTNNNRNRKIGTKLFILFMYKLLAMLRHSCYMWGYVIAVICEATSLLLYVRLHHCYCMISNWVGSLRWRMERQKDTQVTHVKYFGPFWSFYLPSLALLAPPDKSNLLPWVKPFDSWICAAMGTLNYICPAWKKASTSTYHLSKTSLNFALTFKNI